MDIFNITITAMANFYYVYMLANKNNGTLYIGITSNLLKRIYEHKNGSIKGFTKKYHVKRLVWYEETSDAISAIQREKQIKAWKRQWKINLIKQTNPNWKDLYYQLF